MQAAAAVDAPKDAAGGLRARPPVAPQAGVHRRSAGRRASEPAADVPLEAALEAPPSGTMTAAGNAAAEVPAAPVIQRHGRLRGQQAVPEVDIESLSLVEHHLITVAEHICIDLKAERRRSSSSRGRRGDCGMYTSTLYRLLYGGSMRFLLQAAKEVPANVAGTPSRRRLRSAPRCDGDGVDTPAAAGLQVRVYHC
jgi:hypothetical protein